MERTHAHTKDKSKRNPTPHESQRASDFTFEAEVLRLQRLVGNQMVQRMLAQNTPTIQRDDLDGSDLMSFLLPGAESGEPEIPIELQNSVNHATMSEDDLRERYRLIETTLAQFTVSTPETALLEDEQIHVREALVARLIENSIEIDLSGFQNINVTVSGFQPLPDGTQGPPSPITVPVTVHAAYFINTETAQTHYEDERATAGFNSIIRALRDEGGTSLLTGGTNTRTAGRAVELGKATPDDVRRFIQEAIDNGTMRRYAISEGEITNTQELTDLSAADLQTLIQNWVMTTGVGVDCSGFVQQTLVRSREAVRDELLALGVPESALPAEFSRAERNAASFQNEPRITVPTELKVGDVWVVSNGGHIRIVVEVRQIEDNGQQVIEFDTAESSGDSVSSSPGPTRRTWRTNGLANFTGTHKVGETGGQGGTFHRPR
jgi:hypothetical protein